MPPQPDNPQTPKAASPSLLAAFRSLTGQKKPPGSLSTASTPAAESPATLSFFSEGSSSGSRQQLKRAKTTASPGLLDANGHTVEYSVDDEMQVGGPPQLKYLVDLLGPEHDLEQRIEAANSISALLVEYPVGNVSVIWSRAKDLLGDRNKRTAFDAGYDLMLACIKHTSLDLVERPLFFESAITQALLDQPALCLRALSSLTNLGKSLDGLDSGQVASILVGLLDKSYEDAVVARRKAKTEKMEAASTEELILAEVFQYVVDAIKFSSNVFVEAHLDRVIEQLLLICKKTRAESDLERSLEVLDTIITYSTFPKSSLRPCVEVLCGIFCSVEKLKPRSKSTFWKLLSSYLGPEVLNTLLYILRENHNRPVQDRNVVRGAVQLIQEVIQENQKDSVTKVALSELLLALRGSLIMSSAKLEVDILNSLCVILKTPDMAELLFAEPEWTEFSNIVMHCANGKAVADTHSSPPPNNIPAEQSSKLNKEPAWSSTFSNVFERLTNRMISMSGDLDADRKLSIMSLLLRVSFRLDDVAAKAILEYFVEERLLLPSHNSWLENCHEIRKSLFQDNNRSGPIRRLSLEVLCNAYNCAEALNVTEAGELVYSLINAISITKDLQVLDYLVEFAVGVAQWTADECIFSRVVGVMEQTLFSNQPGLERPAETSPVEVPMDSSGKNFLQPPSLTLTSIVSRSLVKVFLRCLNSSAEKSEKIFHILLSVARSPEPPADARIIALKVLARLRADVSHAVFVTANTESESIAVALSRTTDSAAVLDTVDAMPRRSGKEEEPLSRRQNQNVHGSASQTSAATAPTPRSSSVPARGARPTPPLWMYPGPKGLPEDPPYNSSYVVYSHIDASDRFSTEGLEKVSGRIVLKTGLWLELALDLLQRKELEWETYSYLIVHLGAQLMNHALFVDASPQIKHLRNVLCDLLQNKKFHEPPAATKLKKSDVAICLYDILTKLVSYHHLFAKSEEDEMVKTFVLGIGSWERTSEICIHALSVCCHEIPMSIVKCLDAALQKMVQIITQSTNAVHVLEFLAGLARLPSLFRNFREEEFKAVFGICFRYLQFVRDQRSKATLPPSKITTNSRPSRDGLPSSDNSGPGASLAEVLPQYVYALAYHVMTFWFMALRLQDRPRQMAWIRRNLIFTNERGEEVMEEQSQVTIDLMHRVAYSDRDETLPNSSFALDADGVVSAKSYLVGLSILTVATAGRTGVSHITIRRPSGNKYSVSRPQIAYPPRHQVGITAESFYSPDHVAVTPDDVVQSLYSPLSISPSLASLTEGPIPLPDDEATRRSIASFDRISALDGHKIGIIYIGENQTSEQAILANIMGSADYTAFLNGLGTLTELSGARFNTQGLDRDYGTDGKFTFCWRDRVSELVFHVTTMMPTKLEDDPHCSSKKRHIGNDFVNIVFNNSGLPFKFDTFPSDFNYVNIVISPEARSSFVETRLHAARRRKQRLDERKELEASEKEDAFVQHEEPEDNLFYKVTVMTKPGLPKTSPASETQVVSGKSLPAFVRLLALNASVFAQVWAHRAGGEHVSSWRSRLREIVRLRERHVVSGDVRTSDVQSSPPPTAQATSNEKGTAESILLSRTSVATFFSDGSANRNSGTGGAAEMERTNSSSSYD